MFQSNGFINGFFYIFRNINIFIYYLFAILINLN